jgi:hypothetical protein
MASIKGGKKLQAALARIAAQLGEPATLRVGFLEGSTAPNGDSMPLRAALNDYGHGTTPPRPFFRNMVAAKSPDWPDGIAYQLKATGYDTELTLARTGEAIKGQLQESILDLWSPPLAASTIKKKGFDKPLIEHGDMINAAAWEVKTTGNTAISAPQNGAGGFAGIAKAAQKPTT